MMHKLWLLAVAAIGCSTIQARTDFDRSANFGAYRTFKMLAGKALPSDTGVPPNTMVGDRIREGIKAQLIAKGMTPVDENPDVLVGWVAGARTRQELETMGPYDPMMGPYMFPGYWGPADVWTTEYQHGTLVIDMSDARTHKMVWRAIVEADKNRLSDLGQPPVIAEAVKKAFAKYPPQP
jgi:hypothetical protein